MITSKSKTTAAIIAFFGGSFGLHKAYINSKKAPSSIILSTMFSFTTIPTILGIIDAVRYLSMSEQEFEDYLFIQQNSFIQPNHKSSTQIKRKRGEAAAVSFVFGSIGLQ